MDMKTKPQGGYNEPRFFEVNKRLVFTKRKVIVEYPDGTRTPELKGSKKRIAEGYSMEKGLILIGKQKKKIYLKDGDRYWEIKIKNKQTKTIKIDLKRLASDVCKPPFKELYKEEKQQYRRLAWESLGYPLEELEDNEDQVKKAYIETGEVKIKIKAIDGKNLEKLDYVEY
jgi:hypothetical protein